MIPRITSIENLIATDPGGRNVFGLVQADQVRLAAQSLRLARRVGIVSGFYVVEAQAGETDGPSGAKVVGEALRELGIEVDYITDEQNAPLFKAIGLDPLLDPPDYLDKAQPTHLLAIERVGRGLDGRYRNMRGDDITATTAPLDLLFLEGSQRGLTTIGIGDGGNEIGMGKVFADTLATVPQGPEIATIVRTDFCIAAGVSNWGAYGLAGALSVLAKRDLLPSAGEVADDIELMVAKGGAVDGVTHRRECTVDGLALPHSLRMLEDIRLQIRPSPLERGEPLTVGVLGYGESGRGATTLLAAHQHKVRISDAGPITLDPGTVVAGAETGGHTIEFLRDCDLVVASPGVRADAPIRNKLHRLGVPVMSELELAYQHCRRKLIAVTGTIGKRTTVELMQRLFHECDQALTIGGNRGKPLSTLLAEDGTEKPLAVAVSSFQLETVVNFRPNVSIILNVSEAHLDRHRSIAEYVRIKSRIFMNHHPDDILVLPFDDPRIRPLARNHQGRTLFVSAGQAVDRGAWLVGGKLFANIDGDVEELGPAQPEFPENLLASIVAARLSGIDTDTLARAVRGLGQPAQSL